MPLTCGKGEELNRLKINLRMFDPGCLLGWGWGT